MTTFDASGTVSGAPDAALKFVLITLATNGFTITQRDATSATLIGPGLNSTRQNPILGASKIDVRVDDRSLHVHAELGDVDRMWRFLMWFPFLLCFGLGLFFAVVGGAVFGQQFGAENGVPAAQGRKWALVALGVAMLPAAPWLVLSPRMARMVRNRTHRALETLVANAAYAATLT
jgi:hypothetical protein